MRCLWRWVAQPWPATTPPWWPGGCREWWVPCGTGPSCSEQRLEILNGAKIPWLSLLAFIAIVILLFVCQSIHERQENHHYRPGGHRYAVLLPGHERLPSAYRPHRMQVKAEQTRTVRMHSPVFGPQDAPVTIVEFLTRPARDLPGFLPHRPESHGSVSHRHELVIPYAPFHQGSDQVVKLLESDKSGQVPGGS